jgi:predicted amidohydrolase YtcJ
LGVYKHFEEDIKGSIEKDKQANFVVLDSNPFKISTVKIKNIKVLQATNDDKTVYVYVYEI